MLHTNLIGCRGKTKRDTKYNISTLKGKKNVMVLSRLKKYKLPSNQETSHSFILHQKLSHTFQPLQLCDIM